MMNIKKTLAGIASYALVGAVALGVGGTLAHLETQTPSVKNTQTSGNVKIMQNEQERVSDKADEQHTLQAFTQNKTFIPAFYDGNSIPWAEADEWVEKDNAAWKVVKDNPNVLDKFVTVTNTGSLPAYVRTIVAVEVGTNAVADPFVHPVVNDGESKDLNGNMILDGKMSPWKWIDGTVEIDGGTYQIGYVTYLEPLNPSETTVPSLKQLYLGKEATEETIASFGDNFDVLVVSQAVQTGATDVVAADGTTIEKHAAEVALDEAFKEISTTNHPWMNTDGTTTAFTSDTSWYTSDVNADVYTINSADELIGFAELVNEKKINFSGKTIKLDANISLAGYDWEPIGQTGATTFAGIFDGQSYSISNLTIDTTGDSDSIYHSAGIFGWVEDHSDKTVIKNINVDNATVTGGHNVGVIVGWTNADVIGCTVSNATVNGIHDTRNKEDGNKVGVIAGYGYDAVIDNNTAINSTVSAGRDAGQIVGAAKETDLHNNSVTNVTVTANGASDGSNIREEHIGRVMK